MKIIIKTILAVFKREGIAEEGMVTATDLGDYLLNEERITQEEYKSKQIEARNILEV